MFRLAILRRCGALLVCACALLQSATATAAEREFLKLEAEGFEVISQLDAAATEAWAVEFQQFVTAMHALHGVERAALPPLTIVLFEEPREFAPYRLRTDSGQARVAAFFGNTGDWSIIGMPTGGRDAAVRQTIYHEAAHWFDAANEAEQPLWLAEGLAEVLSTFTVVDGNARWGLPVDENTAALARTALLPIDELLATSQDESLHGSRHEAFYPQAWALVHYLLFGRDGVDGASLSARLHELRSLGRAARGAPALGAPTETLAAELRRYLDEGRYRSADLTLAANRGDFSIEPASPDDVDLALGRLATVGANLDLARHHAERVVAAQPAAPAGYELAAYVAYESADGEALDAALARASRLGSTESWIYSTQADRLLLREQRAEGRLDERLDRDTAREAADLYRRALTLRPRNTAAVTGLTMALLNVATVADSDRAALRDALAEFPTNGLALVGQAAAAKSRGDLLEALRLLAGAETAPFALPRRYRAPIAGLRNGWLGDWLLAEIGTLTAQGRFAESHSLIETHLADATLTAPLRAMLESVAEDLPDFERLHAALVARRAGHHDEAEAILAALVNDPTTGERAKREAARALAQEPKARSN